MIFPFPQNWRTSLLPFSLALKNTVNTGVSFDTASGAIANSQRWASRGFQGFGPRMQYPGAGMDGLGCGCGCDSGSGLPLLLLGAALYWITRRERVV
jgi:hypothetical protein